MATPALLKTYRTFKRLPFGEWLFSRAVCWKAPYFGSIGPTITRLEPGRCEATIADRRRVHNHIGTVHAIALCNLAELCAGVMTDASLPSAMRWIPKGMTVRYLKKAAGRMHAVATPGIAIEARDHGYDLPVRVDIRDASGETVFDAEITMWLSPRAARG